MAEPLTIEMLLSLGGASPTQDRRAHERFDLNDIKGELISGATRFACRFRNISVNGCCFQSESPFIDGALAEAKVVLPLFGLVLCIPVETQWIRRENLIGARFTHPYPELKSLLATLLTNVFDKSATQVVTKAAALDVSLVHC